MSETVEPSGAAPETPPPPAEQMPDAEGWARRLGWAPKEEWRGAPEQWIEAPKFLERTLGNPAMVTERLSRLDGSLSRLEREQRESKRQLTDATGTISQLTNMLRTAEERSYKRARDDLKMQRDKAVESGDVAGYRQYDAQMDELDRGRPAPPPAATAPNPQPNGAQPQPQPPEVTSFFQRNPWYTRDPEMTATADDFYRGIRERRSDLSHEEQLAEVEARIRRFYPDRFQQQPRAENPRREEPSSVSSASGTGVPRRETNRRDFASLPQESKQAFERYRKAMVGKGEPLTEKEWTEYYYEQEP